MVELGNRGPSSNHFARRLLRTLLGVLGLTAILIGGSIMTFGAEATANGGEHMFERLTGLGGVATPAWPPAMDNELRFYAALWFVFGVLCLRVAADLDIRLNQVPWLAGTFFLGGIGRAMSWAAVGEPHSFFLFLMTCELALPLGMVALWQALRRPMLPDRSFR